MYACNPAMDSSYPYNYGQFKDSCYYNVNGGVMSYNGYKFSNMHSFVQQDDVSVICGDYSHSALEFSYYPQYENYHYSSYASPQPNFFGLMSNPQIPQHEGNQQFQQSTSLEDMMKQLIDNQQYETTEGLDVLQIEPEIVIALDEEENEMKIDVIPNRPEKSQIKSEKDQPLVLVKPPAIPCIFVKPYKGVEVKERSQIFYTTDTFVLDDHDATYYFVLESRISSQI
ncbi:hypothetical protein Scep_019235 [Stephania cephalantha]|uniref:Uncharacterized protein n=1 Tax=Stephania cephalantha TaxID=152367 RepID=A0AAP0NPN1_9MAGN